MIALAKTIAQAMIAQAAHTPPDKVVAAAHTVLARQGKVRLWPAVQLAFTLLKDREPVITIESAEELDVTATKSLEKDLVEKLPNYRIQFVTNPALLGGYRLRAGTRIFDFSTRAQLDQLEARLMEEKI